METGERSEMQKAFDNLNHIMENYSLDVQYFRAVESVQGPEKEEMIWAWIRKTLDEAVAIKARGPIERWIENAKQVQATGQSEQEKVLAANWQRELEEALAKIT